MNSYRAAVNRPDAPRPLATIRHAIPHVSRIGLGCEQLGEHNWGEVSRRDLEAAVGRALDAGIRFFDTADCYGLGESERRLGELIPASRTDVVVATKFGVRFDNAGRVFYDNSAEWAEQALHASLKRLRRERIELYQLHHWDKHSDLDALFHRLEQLRDAGKIGALGVANVPATHLESSYSEAISTWSDEYSLVRRDHEALALDVAAREIRFIAYGVLAQGLLSGNYGISHRFATNDRRATGSYTNFHGERRVRNEAIVEAVGRAAGTLGTTSACVSIAWALRKLPDAILLVGAKRPAQVEGAVEAQKLTLPPDLMQALDDASSATLTT